MVPVLVLHFIVCGLFYETICFAWCYFVLVFFSPLSIAIISLWEGRANLSVFRTLFNLRLFRLYLFSLPLVSGKGFGLRLCHSLNFFLNFLARGCNSIGLLRKRPVNKRRSEGLHNFKSPNETNLMILLILAGDIKTNPGPRHRCGVCRNVWQSFGEMGRMWRLRKALSHIMPQNWRKPIVGTWICS